jgi:hypothetical protein
MEHYGSIGSTSSFRYEPYVLLISLEIVRSDIKETKDIIIINITFRSSSFTFIFCYVILISLKKQTE